MHRICRNSHYQKTPLNEVQKKSKKKHLYWSAIFLSWSATLLKIACHHGWLCETFLEFPEHNFIPRTSSSWYQTRAKIDGHCCCCSLSKKQNAQGWQCSEQLCSVESLKWYIHVVFLNIKSIAYKHSYLNLPCHAVWRTTQ